MSAALRAPFVALVCAPTGCGKTHSTANIIQYLRNGEIGLVHRFNTKKVAAGTPYQFDRCFYLGNMASGSHDQNHNDNVKRIVDGGEKEGHARTLSELRALASTSQAGDYAGMIKPGRGEDMIPEFITSMYQKFGNGKENLCFVIDDMQAFLNNLGREAQSNLREIFQAGSHHRNMSFFFLTQQLPQDLLGRSLMESSHYFFFPMGAGAGILPEQFRKLMMTVSGYSAVAMQQYSAFQEQDPRPEFLLYNKQRLATAKELMGEEGPQDNANAIRDAWKIKAAEVARKKDKITSGVGDTSDSLVPSRRRDPRI